MIKELFLPEKYNHRRIFAQRILGISIQDDVIYGALVNAKPSKTVIEALISCAIQSTNNSSKEEQLSDALRTCFSQVSSYDQLSICIPASLVIFKELNTPFLDEEKIKMVLDYEVEAMLPFSLDEAVIDFMVTKKNIEEKSSQVLIAAVRKQDLAQILDRYLEAGLDPDTITIDLFGMYNLYHRIQEYKIIPNGAALVDISNHATRVVFMQDGQLRMTRHIQRGIQNIAKSIAEDTGMATPDVIQFLQTTGLEHQGNEAYQKAAQKHVTNLLNDIQFTLNSFSLKLNYQEGISKILYTGRGSDIHNLMNFSSNVLQIPSAQFDPKKLLKDKAVKNSLKIHPATWNHFLFALGATLPAPALDGFNFRQREFARTHDSLMIKQMICACIILIVAFSSLAVRGYYQIDHLTSVLNRIERREVRRLKEIFPPTRLPRKLSLQSLVRESNRILQENIERWAPFRERMNTLALLEELTKIINIKKFSDVQVTQVSIMPKDKGIPTIEIDGYFKAGPDKPLWEHFSVFKQRFEESPLLSLSEDIDESPADKQGIRFVAKLKPRGKDA